MARLGRLLGFTITCLAFISCASDQIQYVTAVPETVSPPAVPHVRDEEVNRVIGVVDGVAVRFGFHRLKYTPEGERIHTESLTRMGFENAPQYGREAGAAYMLLQVGVPISRAQITVAASLVRGGSASDHRFLTEVQDSIEDQLRAAFPAWSIQRSIGAIDRTFAP